MCCEPIRIVSQVVVFALDILTLGSGFECLSLIETIYTHLFYKAFPQKVGFLKDFLNGKVKTQTKWVYVMLIIRILPFKIDSMVGRLEGIV